MGEIRDKSILFPEGDAFGGNDSEALREQILNSLEGRVSDVHFFGSFARADGHYHSDIDLILIKETQEPFPVRAFEFLDLLDIYPNIDILVYTPEEFKDLTEEPTVGFWQSVVQDLS